LSTLRKKRARTSDPGFYPDSRQSSSFDWYWEILSFRNNEWLPSIEEENTGDVRKNVTTLSSGSSIFPHIPIRFVIMIQRAWKLHKLRKRFEHPWKAEHTPSFGNLETFNKEIVLNESNPYEHHESEILIEEEDEKIIDLETPESDSESIE